MNRSIPGLFFLLGASLLLYAYMQKRQTPSAFSTVPTPTLHSQASPSRHHTHSRANKNRTDKPAAPLPKAVAPPIYASNTAKSETPARHMSSLLKTYAAQSFSMSDVIDDLEKRNMNPLLLKDSNPYTGTMFVLRTDSPIPGTRYFHAQYFSDDKKEPYLQHMSFDVQPEPNAFRNSIAAIKQIFGNLKKPSIIKKDFIMWPWKKGYNVWIQKMGKDDLSGDPYNAYAANDIGTIKIAVELDTASHFHSH